jgi:hypothetical protein
LDCESLRGVYRDSSLMSRRSNYCVPRVVAAAAQPAPAPTEEADGFAAIVGLVAIRRPTPIQRRLV